MAKEYQVRVTTEFMTITGAAVRRRADIEVPAGGNGYVGPLSDSQLEELRGDKYLTVKEVTPEAASEVKGRIKESDKQAKYAAKVEATRKAAAAKDSSTDSVKA